LSFYFEEGGRNMKIRTVTISLVFLMAIAFLTPFVVEAKMGPRKYYTYTSHCEYWPDSEKGIDRVWITKGGVEHRRNSYFIGIPPLAENPVPPEGGISIVVRDEEGTEVYNIIGRVELVAIKTFVNRNIDPILRASSGTMKIEVVTVNGENTVGSIEGVYTRTSRTGVKEIFTHGTGFFAGVKMMAYGTTSSAPMAGSRLSTVDMAGTITFPN
jgi:hypothetical protein